VEIIAEHIYFEVQLLEPMFSSTLTSQPQPNKGYAALYVLECKYFLMHFQDIPSKMHIFTQIQNQRYYMALSFGDLLTPRFSHLEILRVRSQYIPYGWHSNNLPETVWFPLRSGTEWFNDDFLVQRQGLHMFSRKQIKIAIFSSSPTFEETKFKGLHGSFDRIFRILASPRVHRASFKLHARHFIQKTQFRGLHEKPEHIFKFLAKNRFQ
jgi:hypothetical protein